MIPKLYAKESGYPPTFNSVGNALNGMGGPIPANFLPSNVYIPETVVIQAGGEMDSLLQNHRRKMLRRAANRRSAQLSRARKKVIDIFDEVDHLETVDKSFFIFL
jgi:hypothetical protein